MSHDLETYTRSKPPRPLLRWLGCDSVSVDGPFEVMAEETDERVREYRPRFTLQLSAPAGASKPEVEKMFEFASLVAAECGGCVWDPQADRVTWPKERRRPARRAKPVEVAVLKLKWFVKKSVAAQTIGREFLRAAAERCRGAFPQAFGTFEPMQGRVSPGSRRGFVQACGLQAQEGLGLPLNFKCDPPSHGGNLFPPQTRADRPARAGVCSTLSIRVDRAAVAEDVRLRWSLVDLFLTVSRRLEAFFACGYVERGYTFSRATLWAGNETECYPFPQTSWWYGLPPAPCWLTWMGEPYARLLLKHFKEAERHPEGFLHRTAAVPQTIEECREGYPRIPSQYCAVLIPKERGMVRRRDGAWTSEKRDRPARVIPASLK